MLFKLLTATLQTKTVLQGGDQGIFAFLAESASEVIHIKGPNHSTSKIVLLQPVNLFGVRGEIPISLGTCYCRRPPAFLLAQPHIPPYLDVEALDVVIANPFAAFVSIGHILGGIPSLGGSRVEECADLGKKGRKGKVSKCPIKRAVGIFHGLKIPF